MMAAGDFPRFPFGLEQRILPFLIISWPKLYLVLFMLSFLFLAASGLKTYFGRATRILFFPVFFLATTFMFSVLFSQEKRMSLEASAYFFAMLFTVHMFSIMLDDANLLEPLWTVTSTAILFLAVKTIAWRLNESLDSGAYLVLNNAWVGKLQIAWVLNFTAPFLFVRYLLFKGWKAWAAGLAWAASGMAVFILFARAGTMMFIVSTLILCALHREQWRKWIALAVILGVGAVFVAVRGAKMSRYIFSTTAQFFVDESISHRMMIWKDSIRMFKHHPLTGIGFGAYDEIAFSRYSAPYNRAPDMRFRRGGWHAHNLHLHILAETGVIGFIAWGYLIYAVFSISIFRWRDSRTPLARGLAQALFLFFIVFLVLSMMENLLAVRVHQSLRMNLAVWFLILLSLASIRASEKNSKIGPSGS